MPWYNDLRPITDAHKLNYALLLPELTNDDRKRIIQNLLELRNALDQQVPPKKSEENLLLASWNIKEFGHSDERLPESYYYIAEIINRFDLVAIQEIKRTLDGLDKIMRLLGDHWKYIITDVTEGTDGNRERFGYIYDTRKVKPSWLSGEITLWDDLTANTTVKQLKRTLAITGFRSGWKDFAIVNVHLHPCNSTDAQKRKKEEVKLLLKVLEEKYAKKHLWSESLILLGDTNIYCNNQDMVALFGQCQFTESAGLAGKMRNVSQSEIYDRLFLRVNEFFRLIQRNGQDSGDVLRFFETIYTEARRADYHSFMLDNKNDPTTLTSDSKFMDYYHHYWKRNQMSDHYPVWIEVEIDSSDDFWKNACKC